ncbi:MAG TPA: glutamine--fructose-6-phosphate transaminase (isomerizing) [Candidatus Anoxymicrobiaceae bacterium]
MCGIVGYLGNSQAQDILFAGLRRLEYRGYDSAGICVISPEEELSCVKVVGNLDAMAAVLDSAELKGNVGIAHTRWATHGAPTELNAHPHLDCNSDIAVVHNGIIENYASLRARLESLGHVFKSQTDTETIAHLIEEYYVDDLCEALRRSLEDVEGAFAVVAIHRLQPGVIVAARRDSPLCMGIGDGEYFVASAVPAFLARTRTVLWIEDDEILAIDTHGYGLTTLEGLEVSREPEEVSWSLDAAEKGGYEDFMLKEINEQPEAVANTLADKFDGDGQIDIDELELSSKAARDLRRIVVVACGTAFHAGLLAKYLFERWAALPVEIEIASEFRYRNLVVTGEDLVVAISQSGETMDTLAGVREATRRGARVIAIVNTVGSQMTREASGVILTHAGPEIGVAATKTFTAQMTAVYLLAMYLGRLRGALRDARYDRNVDGLKSMPEKMRQVLTSTDAIIECARKYHSRDDFLFLGRSVSYPIAMEGALKLKEISYIHAEGYPAGEMKHGPIALLDERVPVVALAPRDSVYEKMVSNIEEVKARSAPVIAVATEGDTEIERLCDDVLWVPEAPEMLTPLLTVLPLQLFAYHAAKMRGCNVDQPRNLAKTVTVE